MRFTAPLLALALLTAAALPSSAIAQNFSVDFTNCTEFAGEGPVSLAAAKPLVPHGFTVAEAAGQANIVIRATSCGSVAVNGNFAQPTILSQIGINIVSPDGTGTINNYTLVYLSNNLDLVAHFLLAGLPAQYDPQLSYQYSGTSTTDGNLYVAAGSPAVAPYFIYGAETAPPPNSATVFLANWWYAPNTIFGTARMRQQTLFPSISFGGSSVIFHTDNTSTLGKLVGGNAYGTFTALALRGVYPTAHMEVTVTH